MRGCYASHIAVLSEAQSRLQGRSDGHVLVLEDNLSISPRATPETLRAVEAFVRGGDGGGRADMVHLAFSLSLPKCRTPTFAICPKFNTTDMVHLAYIIFSVPP